MAKQDFDEALVVKKLQKIWYEEDRNLIAYSTIANIGLNTRKESISIGNFLLKKRAYTDHYTISVIDRSKDLNGAPMNSNLKALKFIQAAWRGGEKDVDPNDLQRYAIHTEAGSFTIGNFLLSSHFFSRNYSLALQDKTRGIDGRIIDEHVTVAGILKDLKKFSIKNASLSAEKVFENHLYDYLSTKYENVHRQASIGGVKALKIDLDIGNGRVGIELKLASKVSIQSEKQRLIGQLHDYTDKKYDDNNLIIIIAGSGQYRADPSIKEVEKIVKKQYECHFVFLESE